MILYKKGQGTPSRIGAVVLAALLGVFAGYSWFGAIFLASAKVMPDETNWLLIVRTVGGSLIFLGISGIGAYVAMFHQKGSDYLIEMDSELRKVVWPAVKPPFDPKAEAWGSAYVVIACTIFLTVFIWLVDMALQATITDGVLGWLFSK